MRRLFGVFVVRNSLRAQRRRIRTDVRQCRAASRDIKIIIGAGETQIRRLDRDRHSRLRYPQTGSLGTAIPAQGDRPHARRARLRTLDDSAAGRVSPNRRSLFGSCRAYSHRRARRSPLRMPTISSASVLAEPESAPTITKYFIPGSSSARCWANSASTTNC